MIKRIIGISLAKLNYRIVKKQTREDIAFAAQKALLGTGGSKTIFDVGAYHGETAIRYNDLAGQDCKVLCFEPFPESFGVLKKNTQGFPNIVLNNIALGAETGSVTFHSNHFSATNSILPTSEKGHETWGRGTLETIEEIVVPVQRLDDHVVEHDIERIDILKLDTQGSEYLVLKGAENTMSKGMIKLIYTEIIVMPTYEGQKDLDHVLRILREYGFELFNFYPAQTSNGQLRYLDALFIYKG